MGENETNIEQVDGDVNVGNDAPEAPAEQSDQGDQGGSEGGEDSSSGDDAA